MSVYYVRLYTKRFPFDIAVLNLDARYTYIQVIQRAKCASGGKYAYL